MTYAIIESGSKSYKIKENDTINIEKINKDIGENIKIEKVLLFVEGEKTEIGKPFLKNIVVEATIIDHYRGEKVNIVKFRRRKHSMTRQGHRQNFTKIKITKIGCNSI